MKRQPDAMLSVSGYSSGRRFFLPRRGGFFFMLVLVFSFSLLHFSCRSTPGGETPLPVDAPLAPEPQQPVSSGGGVVDEIRSLTETGTPSSLLSALEIIRTRGLGTTEFGRVMTSVIVTLIKTLYPAVQSQLPPLDPPLTHVYSRILRDAERGVYSAPQNNSADFLENLLPFLAFYSGTSLKNLPAENYLSAMPDLERAAQLNRESALPVFFIGNVYEHSGRQEDAVSQYTKVWELYPECFPAALSLARIMEAQGRRQDALRFLSDLVLRFPDNLQVKRQLALIYYRNGDWSRAEGAVAEILQKDSRDGEFVLMRAHIFVEQGQLLQAQAPLDIYAGINSNNRLYLFLRARVQAEAYHNRDAALNYLRSILRGSPGDAGGGWDNGSIDLWSASSLYAARLLMESSRPEDQNEGRGILRNLLAAPAPSLNIVSLALEDAVRREAWAEARPYLSRLLEQRRSVEDLLSAYVVEKGQGNNAAALSYARELYERDRSSEEGVIAYISALIDTGRREEAAAMIESRIGAIPGGVPKSRYFYLRSRVRTNEELVMNDLRSSLFEDPRNLDALIALFEIYHRRRDERRAVYYLKQALAIAPQNPRLKRYESEYQAALQSY